MTRKLTVNGKRELLAVRVSEPVLAAVQQAAGGKEQTPQWVRDAVYAALAAKGLLPDEGPAPSEAASHPVPVKRARKTRKAPERQVAGPPPPRPDAPPLPPARTRPAHAPGAPVFQDPGGEAIIGIAPPAPAATRTKCGHQIFRVFGSRDPAARGVNGCCPSCGHAVLPGGYWEPECDAGTCGHPGV